MHGSNLKPPMSALGQKQTLRNVGLMSALPPKADMPTGVGSKQFLLRALAMRYEYGGLKNDLAPEKAWLETVKAKLMAGADSMSRIGRYRVMLGVKTSITSALNKAKTD